MCGIYLGKNKYNNQMVHRGITTHEKQYNNLFFAHEHLPIQADISDYPIIETDSYIILFNGELFFDNPKYDSDLDYIKDVFESTNDLNTAIDHIVHTDGFYSFIIYDKRTVSIYAFTDPLGKKQLYYNGETIASEIKALRKTYLDKRFLSKTIKFGYVTDNSTPYTNIKRVLPNKLYRFSFNCRLQEIVNEELYGFKYEYKNKNITESKLYDAIDLSVKNRLKGHSKVGMLLSGGLDSSIIYHHAKDQLVQFNTYCVNNEEDLNYARMMDSDVYPIHYRYSENALEAMEMPVDLGSMYQQYSLFGVVGETVILTGDGADEVFGGYKRMNNYDSQLTDVFDELPFYHNIRLDRMSMIHTKEARSPFMSLPVVELGLSLPYSERINKKFLRETYSNMLPKEIVYRPKEALKSETIRNNTPEAYRNNLANKFINLISK